MDIELKNLNLKPWKRSLSTVIDLGLHRKNKNL